MRARNNPFHGLQEDLSQKQLSADEKLFIGSLVGKDGETTRSIGEFYRISKSAVCRYSAYYKRQITPKKCGRPPKLDDVSTEVIRKALRGEKRIQIDGPEYMKLLHELLC